MHYVPAIIIGGGQAGLAMSHCLGRRRIDHIVLERGQIGERWRSERWDTLRLLTPNWMSRLPGWSYHGDDPDGFMTAPEFVGYLEAYAATSRAPVQAGASVISVRPSSHGYRVETSRGVWEARVVVIATGYCDVPRVPALAQRLPRWIDQVSPSEYRNPGQLRDGAVLVVGASATGVQLAAEIRRSGRTVAISVGSHTRLPRSYRGRDTWWWLEQTGLLDETTAEVSDLQRARARPSFQLVGGPDGHTLDLGTLRDMGVRIVGRTISAAGTTLRLRRLAETTGAAQAALERLLGRIDVVADGSGAPPAADAACVLELGSSPTALDLRTEGIRTVLWATGYGRNYSWLKVPVLDEAGEILHDRGITPCPDLCPRTELLAPPKVPFHRRLSASMRRTWRNTSIVTCRRHTAPPHRRRTRECSIVPGTMDSGRRRCAGAATAMLMARCGLKVLVIDRGRYAADTMSTHALMRGGVTQLHRWGLLPRIVASGTPAVRSTAFHYGDDVLEVDVRPRHGVEALYAPRRTLLDSTLVDAARRAGAEVRHECTLTGLVRNPDGRVGGAVIFGADGKSEVVATDLVIGADGIGSAVARLVGPQVLWEGRHASSAVYGHWSGLDAPGYSWYYREGVSAGIIPTNGGAHCVFVAVPPNRFRDEVRHDLAAGYRRALAEVSPNLAAAVAASRLEGGRLWAFAGRRGFLREACGPGWALVGDAGYFKDPLTAHGMTDALVAAASVGSVVPNAPAERPSGPDEPAEQRQPRSRLSTKIAASHRRSRSKLTIDGRK